jgi:hypothetical protein
VHHAVRNNNHNTRFVDNFHTVHHALAHPTDDFMYFPLAFMNVVPDFTAFRYFN